MLNPSTTGCSKTSLNFSNCEPKRVCLEWFKGSRKTHSMSKAVVESLRMLNIGLDLHTRRPREHSILFASGVAGVARGHIKLGAVLRKNKHPSVQQPVVMQQPQQQPHILLPNDAARNFIQSVPGKELTMNLDSGLSFQKITFNLLSIFTSPRSDLQILSRYLFSSTEGNLQ